MSTPRKNAQNGSSPDDSKTFRKSQNTRRSSQLSRSGRHRGRSRSQERKQARSRSRGCRSGSRSLSRTRSSRHHQRDSPRHRRSANPRRPSDSRRSKPVDLEERYRKRDEMERQGLKIWRGGSDSEDDAPHSRSPRVSSPSPPPKTKDVATLPSTMGQEEKKEQDKPTKAEDNKRKRNGRDVSTTHTKRRKRSSSTSSSSSDSSGDNSSSSSDSGSDSSDDDSSGNSEDEAKTLKPASTKSLDSVPRPPAPDEYEPPVHRPGDMWDVQNIKPAAEPDEVEAGPALPRQVETKLDRRQYGGALMPGEGDAIAQFVQSGQRIPRRGEIGLTSTQIEDFEKLGFVMSGSRHKRMNAVRIRKESQIYSAEEKRALALLNSEEKQAKEKRLLAEFRKLLPKVDEPA